MRRTRERSRPLMEALESRVLLAATLGSLDVVTTWPNGMPFQVAGWAYDADVGPNGNGPVTVRLDVDGFPQATQHATVLRPDIVGTVGSAAHGYQFTVVPLAPGAHTLQVVAIDQPFGEERTLGTQSVTVQPGALGNIDSFTSTNVSGWALDPAVSSASIVIRVDVDGTPFTTQSAFLPRQDLLPFFGSSAHGFNIALPNLPQGAHRVDVYALPNQGGPTLLGTFAATPPGPPFGSLDAANASIIGGWAVDPDSPSAPTQIRIDIDGLPFRSLITDIARPDLTGFGSAPFGFQFNTPLLGAGSHSIEMFAIDKPSGNAVLIGQRTLTVGQRDPIGNVDILTPTLIAGWALDPDDPSKPVQFRIDIDTVQTVTASASLQRPDLIPIFGSSAHGFSTSIGPLSPGSHLIEVYAIDLESGVRTLLRSSTLSIPL